jgi:hypothetical protein
MSCPSSAPTHPRASDSTALVGALVAVAERSFFAYAEPYVEPAGREAVGTVTDGWYQASVSFQGPFTGCVLVALPIGLARDLCVSFLGVEPDATIPDSAVCDLAGELTNMVCGSWLSGLGESSCFDLSHPEVRRIPAPPAAGMVVAVNDLPAIVGLGSAAGVA